MPIFGNRLRRVARDPRAARAALIRRIVPTSPTRGFPWIELPDGSITFHERGFVSAESPAMLLARHYYETQRIRAELSTEPCLRVLEIGCGYGRLSPTLDALAQSHIAVDINSDALNLARRAYPTIDFRNGGVPSLQFDADEFDTVVSWTVLQHVRPENISRAAAEIRRVMSSGGTLLLCEETQSPNLRARHAWHRSVDTYVGLFSPLRLERHSLIEELETMSGMRSPGEVMLFRG